ncbi:MAG TPA: transporter substrate-binding domain-containing protein, partial [Burkholderiaceae bacterium]
LAAACAWAQTPAAAAPAPVPAPAAGPLTITLCFEKLTVLPWRTEDGRGLDFDMLREVAKRLNVRFKYEALPWKRCLAELKDNKMDGAFSASFRPDRLEIGAYPGGANIDNEQRMHIDRYVLIRRKGSKVQWDGKQFHNLDGAVGAQLGYSIVEHLRGLGVPVDEGSQRGRELTLKLIAGRVAAAAVGGSEAVNLLASDPKLAAQVEMLPIPLTEKPYFLVLSHAFAQARPELAAAIWKTMEQVRNSPEYRKLERDAVQAQQK